MKKLVYIHKEISKTLVCLLILLSCKTIVAQNYNHDELEWYIFNSKKEEIIPALRKVFNNSDEKVGKLNRPIFFELYCDSLGNIDSVLVDQSVAKNTPLTDNLISVFKNQKSIKVFTFPCNGINVTIKEYEIAITFGKDDTMFVTGSLNDPCPTQD